MQKIALKFGGSSLASAEQFRKVRAIIEADPARRYVVASAPGKRDKSDTKVTDLLYRCYDAAVSGGDYLSVLAMIAERFQSIISELDLSFDLDSEISVIASHLKTSPQRDYMASRGEYLNSRILAAYLGIPFVDPATCVHFSEAGSFRAEMTNTSLGKALEGKERAVVAGFYGALPDGTVHTFSRGGSDVTGAIVAQAVNADIYENWTDVSGMLAADPRIVDAPRPIEVITYRELRELSYMGASVLHEDAVFPVHKAGIPINIRNTNAPQDPGSMIVPRLPAGVKRPVVTGIAGKKGFVSVNVDKSMMNSEVGFGSRMLNIFARHGLSFEHIPSGIDTMSVVLSRDAFEPVKDKVVFDICRELDPDGLSIQEKNIALIAVVGQGMASAKGTAAAIFAAIAENEINIRMIDQGSSEMNIIIGVDEEDYEKAVCAIYHRIFG